MPRFALDVSRTWDVNAMIAPSASLGEQSTTSSQPSPALFFFLGGIVIVLIVLILIFVFRKIIKPKKLKMFIARTMKQPVAKDVISGNLHTISYYDFQTLKKATKNFQEKNVLGRGGFGPVFMGKLEDGRLIAVKKLSLDKSQQGESEFLAEVRIGDFGLARFFPEGQDFLSTRFAGTLGYTAPEYAIRGELSEKADIFSFGVLVLEIISCRKNTDLSLPSEMQYLPEYAWKLYERSKLVNLIDPRMRDRVVEKDVLQAIHVAFLCLEPRANLRPPMSEIVAMLTCKVDVAGKLTRPVFLDRKQRQDEKLSWDSLTEPSPVSTEE
ncbi:unnamed protein product [Fraxinus pennsylvanica]|uniref:Protein kinase domain-containing protein n=1 Tax=Fraxinus pennsylvanica TaxID=56036 RepID=A0AAD2EA16_9LAMI|nr:unnamed protein product [Fraxinus pennsylvanica]